jgi:TPP-dependent pyruvate/acetoin dehydrogenase alpha subunit
MSLASSLALPLVVVVQNNQVALGTRVEVHTRAPLDKLHVAYGVKGYTCDGNHVLDTYAATAQAATDCRKGRGPVLVTATTFRMGGHATHDEAEARDMLPAALFQYWGRRDPVGTYEAWLERSDLRLEEGAAAWVQNLDALPEERSERNRFLLGQVARAAQEEVERAASEALESRDTAMPDGSDVDQGVYSLPCD